MIFYFHFEVFVVGCQVPKGDFKEMPSEKKCHQNPTIRHSHGFFFLLTQLPAIHQGEVVYPCLHLIVMRSFHLVRSYNLSLPCKNGLSCLVRSYNLLIYFIYLFFTTMSLLDSSSSSSLELSSLELVVRNETP